MLCPSCRREAVAKGYDECCECHAAFLLANPAELAEFLSYPPVDEWDAEILAIIESERETT